MAGIWANEGRASASGSHRSTAPRVGLGEPARRPRERRRLARHRRIKHERDAAHRGFAGRCHRHRPDANALRTRLDDCAAGLVVVLAVCLAGAGTNSQARGGLGRIAGCRGVHYRVWHGQATGRQPKMCRSTPSICPPTSYTYSQRAHGLAACCRSSYCWLKPGAMPARKRWRSRELRRCDSRCSAFRASERCS